MFIAFLIKIIGICFGLRILETFFRKNNIPDSVMTKIVSGFLFFQCLHLIFLPKNRWQLVFIFLPILVFIGLTKIYLKWLETRFQSEFPDVLTNIILQMKTGKSFRVSLLQSVQSAPPRFCFHMQRIYELVVFSQQGNDKKMALKTSFLNQIVLQFCQIDRSSFKSIEKLENFRRKLVIMNQFRRKSGQIRNQVRMQSNILILMYGLCFAFVSFNFALNELKHLIFCSLLMFIAGQFLVFWMGKRVSWKI
ncbi:MAG: hypothetical protein K2Q26_02440 [Bdellovibrionales bacterium]|nr:hypothetical protein [Bdellovibrionales bacterium]